MARIFFSKLLLQKVVFLPDLFLQKVDFFANDEYLSTNLFTKIVFEKNYPVAFFCVHHQERWRFGFVERMCTLVVPWCCSYAGPQIIVFYCVFWPEMNGKNGAQNFFKHEKKHMKMAFFQLFQVHFSKFSALRVKVQVVGGSGPPPPF